MFEFAQNLVTLSCTASAVANNHADLIACCLARAVKQVPLAFLIYDFDEVLGADIIAIDGFRGGTGATPLRIRDHVGLPIEFALAAIDSRLRQEGIRNQVSIVVAGSIRHSADVVKAIALGADAVYIASAALIALGCHMCQKCYTGKCNWGIATQEPSLVKRLNPQEGTRRAVNLLRAWKLEIKEMLGGMGINALESLRGNRLMLRGIGLTERELNVLGVSAAGE